MVRDFVCCWVCCFSGFAVFLVCGYCGFVAAEAGVMLLFECIVLLG